MRKPVVNLWDFDNFAMKTLLQLRYKLADWINIRLLWFVHVGTLLAILAVWYLRWWQGASLTDLATISCCGKVTLQILFVYIGIFFAFLYREATSLDAFMDKYGSESGGSAIKEVASISGLWNEVPSPSTGKDHMVVPNFHGRSKEYNPKHAIDLPNRDAIVIEMTHTRYLPWSEDQGNAIRELKNYFLAALNLYRSGVLRRSTFRRICKVDALNLLFKVIEPAEYLLNKEYDWRAFYMIMDIMKHEFDDVEKSAKEHKYTRMFWDDVKGWVSSK